MVAFCSHLNSIYLSKSLSPATVESNPSAESTSSSSYEISMHIAVAIPQYKIKMLRKVRAGHGWSCEGPTMEFLRAWVKCLTL